MADFIDSMTLAEARDLLRTLVDEGHRCPVCTQNAKVYKRPLNSAMARGLIEMYHRNGVDEFVHVNEIPGHSHELAQASWWGLIEEEKRQRPDGGRTGWWMLTYLGWQFVLGRATIEKYAHVYDGRVLRFSGDRVDIRAALGTKFDYQDLMSR